jgi:hypothetical protein
MPRGVATRVAGPTGARARHARISTDPRDRQQASANAIETYTNISRKRARDAIDDLVKVGLVRVVDRAKPEYELVPLRREKDRRPVWLPNELVTGKHGGESPIELLRQVQDRMLLQLFVTLYEAQDLREQLGIDRALLFGKHMLTRLADRGECAIWAFQPNSQKFVTSTAPFYLPHARRLTKEQIDAGESPVVDFFSRIDVLTGLHLLDWQPVVFESDDPTAEAVVEFGTGHSESLEDRVGAAADEAGRSLLSDGHLARVDHEGLRVFPLGRHLSRVTVVSVARLRYRPRTRATSAWLAERHRRSQGCLERLERITSNTAPVSTIQSASMRKCAG